MKRLLYACIVFTVSTSAPSHAKSLKSALNLCKSLLATEPEEPTEKPNPINPLKAQFLDLYAKATSKRPNEIRTLPDMPEDFVRIAGAEDPGTVRVEVEV